MNKSDLEIVEALRQGDREAFYELYRCYADLIYRNILVRVNSSFDADDIFQEFFVQLWERHKDIRVETNLRGYLLAWLKHHILNTIKERQIRERYHVALQLERTEEDDYTWVKITSEDLNVRLREVVNKFPPRLQTVYVLSREQHLSVKEIAGRLGSTEQTVKNQLTDILRRLRNELKNKKFIFFI